MTKVAEVAEVAPAMGWLRIESRSKPLRQLQIECSFSWRSPCSLSPRRDDRGSYPFDATRQFEVRGGPRSHWRERRTNVTQITNRGTSINCAWRRAVITNMHSDLDFEVLSLSPNDVPVHDGMRLTLEQAG
jgi:hypothetical protein